MSALHRAIYGERKRLGLDDDAARGLYLRVTGKDGLRLMTSAEHDKVLAELKRQTGASNAPRKRLEGPFAGKLQALWIAGWNLGLVENREDAAMLAFVERQTGIPHTRFLIDARAAKKAIEGLKAWIAREGDVDWTQRKVLPPTMNDERFRVAWAQFRVLTPGATYVGNLRDFFALAGQMLGTAEDPDLSQLTPRQWQAVMNELGVRVRAKLKGAA